MFSSFIVIVTWVSLMGMCQGDLESTNLSPLSIVYTVYPYYNSETLLEILKTEETQKLSSNDVQAIGRKAETRENQSGVNAGAQDEISENSDDRNSNESTRQRAEQASTHSEITYWPPIQRGAIPKPRTGRATGLPARNLRNGV